MINQMKKIYTILNPFNKIASNIVISIGLFMLFAGITIGTTKPNETCGIYNFTDMYNFTIAFFIFSSFFSVVVFLIDWLTEYSSYYGQELRERNDFQIFIGSVIFSLFSIIFGHIYFETIIVENIQYIFSNIFIANIKIVFLFLIILIILTIMLCRNYKSAIICLIIEFIFLLFLFIQIAITQGRIETYASSYCSYFPKTEICTEMKKMNFSIYGLSLRQQIKMANKIEKIKRKEHIEEIRENKKRKNVEKKEMIKEEKIIQKIKIK